MTSFNPGPWNHHHGLSFLVCTRKAVYNLLSHIPYGKPVVVQEGKTDGNWTDSCWHWSQIVWHKTGMLQHCHRTHPHANTWPCILTSIHSWNSLASLSQVTGHSSVCSSTCHKLLNANMPKQSSYQKFKHACLVRSSRSLARWSSRLRHLLRYLRYKENICAIVNTKGCTKSIPNIFQINLIKN